MTMTRPGTRAHDNARPPLRSVPTTGATELRLDEVWDRHGSAVYSLACAVLGDEAAATQAATLGMLDLARTSDLVPAQDARRSLARLVYLHSQDLLDDPFGTHELPLAMVWLAQLAPLQRGALALCCFGGHNHREAAELLGVSPIAVAELLIAGLRELGEAPASTTSTGS